MIHNFLVVLVQILDLLGFSYNMCRHIFDDFLCNLSTTYLVSLFLVVNARLKIELLIKKIYFCLISSISVKSLENVSAVISDNECPLDLLEQATNLDIPVVSLTWVQQCIVDNDRRPYRKHPAYLYSYVSEPESPEY